MSLGKTFPRSVCALTQGRSPFTGLVLLRSGIHHCFSTLSSSNTFGPMVRFNGAITSGWLPELTPSSMATSRSLNQDPSDIGNFRLIQPSCLPFFGSSSEHTAEYMFGQTANPLSSNLMSCAVLDRLTHAGRTKNGGVKSTES